MHKEVHERTSQQQQIRKNAEQVRPVFREQEEPYDREKHEQHQTPSRAKPTAVF